MSKELRERLEEIINELPNHEVGSVRQVELMLEKNEILQLLDDRVSDPNKNVCTSCEG